MSAGTSFLAVATSSSKVFLISLYFSSAKCATSSSASLTFALYAAFALANCCSGVSGSSVCALISSTFLTKTSKAFLICSSLDSGFDKTAWAASKANLISAFWNSFNSLFVSNSSSKILICFESCFLGVFLVIVVTAIATDAAVAVAARKVNPIINLVDFFILPHIIIYFFT
ncbi:hypothetical protein OMHANJPE_00574 [Mycoplasmopsis arginini]|nr:hypothetical protein [Mycoplasmopsis arginini]